jgi:endonuclease
MALYSKPVHTLMKEMAAELANTPDATFTRQDAVKWFSQKYPKIKVGTVTAHLTRLSTNARSRTHYSAKPGEDDILYQTDGSHYRLYRADQDPAPLRTDQQTGATTNIPEGEDEQPTIAPIAGGSEFAYETDLRNYLAKNLSALQPGLRIYEEDGITGIEFPVGGRFIDILAMDANGNLVVIELKVSRGYDRVVGQLMRYVAWIKKNLAESNQQVRGVIVAREISEDLLLACSMVPGIELFEYELSLALKRVN